MSEWRVVLDTMVWLSAAVNPKGACGEIVRLAVAGRFRLVTSPAIKREVLEVMTRDENADLFDPRFDIVEWLEVTELGTADVVEDSKGPRVSVDPEDDMFCWAAYVGAATHLVSKDPDLKSLKHYRGTQIVDPGAFLKLWRRRG